MDFTLKPFLLLSLFWVPSLIGYGAAFLRLLSRQLGSHPTTSSLAEAGIAGFWVLGFFCGAAHLFSGVSPWVPVFCVGGWVAVAVALRRKWLRQGIKQSAAFIFFISLTCLSGFFSLPVFDVGGYHLPISKWVWEQPMPIGVGNLHQLFGYHSDWYLIGAGLTLPSFGWHSLLVMDCWLLAFFLSFLLDRIGQRRPIAAVAVLTMAQLFVGNMMGNAGAGSSDLPSFLLVAVAFFTWLEADGAEQPNLFLQWKHFLALFWLSFAVSIKLSSAPLLLGLLLFTLRRWTLSSNRNRRQVLALVGIPFITLIGWEIRSVFYNGYLALPAKVTRLSFLPWALPPEYAGYLDRFVKCANGSPLCDGLDSSTPHSIMGEQLPSLLHDNYFRVGLLFLFLALMVFLHRKIRRIRSAAPQHRAFLEIAALILGGTVFWFVMAPAPRFAYPYALAGSIWLGWEIWRAGWWKPKPWLFGVMAISLLLLWGKRIFVLQQDRNVRWEAIEFLPDLERLTATSANGVPYYLSPRVAQCYDLPIPCGYHENQNLIIEKREGDRYYFRPVPGSKPAPQ